MRRLLGTLADRPVTVRVARSGWFSISLPPGRYDVAGRSPYVAEVTASGVERITACSQPLSVTVTARNTARITVICVVP